MKRVYDPAYRSMLSVPGMPFRRCQASSVRSKKGKCLPHAVIIAALETHSARPEFTGGERCYCPKACRLHGDVLATITANGLSLAPVYALTERSVLA